MEKTKKMLKIFKVIVFVLWVVIGVTNIIEGNISRVEYGCVWSCFILWYIMDFLNTCLLETKDNLIKTYRKIFDEMLEIIKRDDSQPKESNANDCLQPSETDEEFGL